MTVWASTIRDDTPDSDYVALGNDPAFAAVGTFTANLTGCGTLIAPDWVLTAAHLILGAHSGTFTLDGTAYSAAQIITDPNWDGNPSDGNDFALVQLSSSLTPHSAAALHWLIPVGADRHICRLRFYRHRINRL